MEEKKDWKKELKEKGFFMEMNRNNSTGEEFMDIHDDLIFEFIEELLDRAREEEFEQGLIKGRLEALPVILERTLDGDEIEIMKKILNFYDGHGTDFSEVERIEKKLEKLSKLTTK